MRTKQTVSITYRGLELEVTGEYYAGCRGRMYLRNGDPGYPAEPPEFSIDTIKHGGIDMDDFFDGLCEETRLNGKVYHEDCYNQIEALCLEKIGDESGPDYEPEYGDD